MSAIFFIRKVKVDRTRTPQQALDATGRAQYTNQEVVDAMPQGEGEEVEVYFFPLTKELSVDQLKQKVYKAGFELVDPITLSALNEADPSLADTYPNATQWRNKNGTACYVSFNRWHGGRAVGVDVFPSGCDWRDHWFIGCVRKKSSWNLLTKFFLRT